MDEKVTEKRTSISRKLLTAMAIPVLFVALMAGTRVVEARRDLEQVHQQTKLAQATGGPSTLVSALLDERNITGLEMLGTSKLVKLPGVTDAAGARIETDKAMSAFKTYLDGAGTEVRSIYLEPYEQAAKQLSTARKQYDDYAGLKEFQPDASKQTEANFAQYASAKEFYDNYSDIVELFIEANSVTLSRIDDAILRNRATAIASQTEAVDLLSRISRTAVLAVLHGGTAEPQERPTVARLYERYEQAHRDTMAGLDGDKKHQAVFEKYFNRTSYAPFPKAVDKYLLDGKMDASAALAMMKAAAGTETIDGKDVVEKPSTTDAWNAALASLNARSDALISEATSKVWSNVLLFVVSAGLSALAAVLISRSISKPLLDLARQAHVMSSELLPEAVHGVLATPVGREIVVPRLAPLQVDSRDEVADVASALTEVQDRALSLAVEQAALRHNFADAFVNLGRRMQGLVLRQLEFITDLEDAETVESNLSNLFKLDHIATRIRRNAESLIVLGGVEKRATGRMLPMEAVDIVRAALSEVEDYHRVDITDFDEARLPGDVATDVSHIIAELLENGLMYSPPDSFVEVTGRHEGTGFLFTIADHGIGMDDEAIEKANLRLSGQEDFSVAPSRYLGHYIAGHLAAGVGAQIRVKQGPDGGILAGVFLPSKLIIAHST